MEDILSVYARPADVRRPLVCLDEFSKQLLSDVTAPLPTTRKHKAKQDYEYVREGFASAYMIATPHVGTRDIFISKEATHNSIDFAHAIQHLVDNVHPEAEKIVLVMDNLNTHSEVSLYKAFEAKEARRLAEKLEIHYTPKHGSWLNMAEIEISKVNRMGLKERISSKEKMREQISAYLDYINSSPAPIKWQFTNENARIKLKALYPTI